MFYLSFLVAVVPSSLVMRHYHVRGWLNLLGVFVIAAIAAGIVVVFYWLGERIFLRFADRRFLLRNPNEAFWEAERFYYLAVWAVLTGRSAFGRRMLTNAKQMGFSDSTRLQDKTLSNIID